METVDVSDISKIEKKKDEYYFSHLYQIHEKMSKNYIWGMWGIILCVAIIFDLIPCPYIGFFEEIFDYDFSDFISILIVVWTFAITIVGYWLDKEEKRIYEIKVIHLLVFKYGVFKIIAFLGIIMFELVALIIIAIAEWKITAVFLALVLVHTVVYAFLSFSVIPTEYNMRKQIRKEMLSFFPEKNKVEIYAKGLLIRVLKGMRKSKEMNEDDLVRIMNVISEAAMTYLGEQPSISRSEEIYSGCKLIVDDIIKFEWSPEKKFIFLKNWIEEKQTPLEVKQAVVALLLDNALMDDYIVIEKLLGTENKHFRELYIWTIVYCLDCRKYVGREWQKLCIVWLREKFELRWHAIDTKRAIDYWKIIHGLQVRNFAPLFNYINEVGKEPA